MIYYFFYVVCLIYFFISVYRIPTKPTPYMVFFFSLYYLSSVLGDRVLIYQDGFEIKWIFYFLTVISALFCGEYVAKRVKFGVSLNVGKVNIIRGIRCAGFVILPFCIFYLYGIIHFLLINPGSDYGSMWEKTRDLIIFGNPALIFGLIVVCYYFFNHSRIAIICLMIIVLVLFLTGERGGIAMLLFALLPAFLYGHKRKIFVPIILLLVIAVAGIYGNVRAQIVHGPLYFSKNIANRVIDEPLILLSPFDINEFVNISTVTKAAMHDGFEIDTPGINIVRGIVKVVPVLGRYAFSSHDTTGELVRDRYYEKVKAAGVATGSGALIMYGFDLYLTGGFFILFIGVYLASYYLNRLYIGYISGNLFSQILYILSFPLFVLQAQRSGFESLAVYLIKYHYFVVFFILFFHFVSSRKRARLIYSS